MANTYCLKTEMCVKIRPLYLSLGCLRKYLLALIGLIMGSVKDKWKKIFIGCLGCCVKPPLVISVDEPSKGLKIQGQRVKKHSLTEDFWSTSSGTMDHSAFQSHRSVSSISTSNQNFDAHSSAGSSNHPSDFVNPGLLLWNQTRQQWIGNKRTQKHVHVQEPKLSWNATYESLLGTNKPFPQPIPLAEMVDFLVDVWEQEGLYD